MLKVLNLELDSSINTNSANTRQYGLDLNMGILTEKTPTTNMAIIHPCLRLSEYCNFTVEFRCFLMC